MYILTTREMKDAEQFADEHGISYLTLMENAGNAISSRLERAYLTDENGAPVNRRVVVLCGGGNNGGDGFVIAARLAKRGCKVTAVLCGGQPATPESGEMFRRMKAQGVLLLSIADRRMEISGALAEAELVIDAVFGTGFHGTLSLALQDLFAEVSGTAAVKLAVDIPSGVGENGVAPGAFAADLTYVTGALKKAHILSAAKPYCGRLQVVPIGIPDEAFVGVPPRVLIDRETALSLLPRRAADSHKGTHGTLLTVAGSRCYPGASLLAALAALRSGVGLCRVATIERNIPALCGQIPEAVWLPLAENSEGGIAAESWHTLKTAVRDSAAVLFGCGMTPGEDTGRLLDRLLQTELPLVIDADGINVLAEHIDSIGSAAPRVLTPHIGEMSRLSGKPASELKADPMGCAAAFAKRYGVTLVLKDAVTVVAAPDGRVFAHLGGNAGMAKGGSGDALAGIIASLLAQGMEATDAAVCGVYLHGAAGDAAAAENGLAGMLPTDLIAALPRVFLSLGR